MECCVNHCKRRAKEFYTIGDVKFGYCKRDTRIPITLKVAIKRWANNLRVKDEMPTRF